MATAQDAFAVQMRPTALLSFSACGFSARKGSVAIASKFRKMQRAEVDGGIDKEKLREKVKRMNRHAEKRRNRSEGQSRAKIEHLQQGIETLTATIVRLRNEQGSAAHRAAKQQREKLRSELRKLETSADTSLKVDALQELFDEHRTQRSMARLATRQAVRQAAITQHRQLLAVTDSTYKHEKAFHNDGDTIDVISRRPDGLGPSQPSQARLGWTKMDFRLAPGQPKFTTRVEDKPFGYVPPPRDLHLGGPGAVPDEVDPAKVAQAKAAAKKKPLWAASHTKKWKTPSGSEGQGFAAFAPLRPADDGERRQAQRFIVPDRVNYDPAMHGKQPWRPIQSDDADKEFSHFVPNDVYERTAKEQQAEELLVKFGLDPMKFKSTRELRARQGGGKPHDLWAEGEALMGGASTIEHRLQGSVGGGSFVQGGTFQFDAVTGSGVAPAALADGRVSTAGSRAYTTQRSTSLVGQQGASIHLPPGVGSGTRFSGRHKKNGSASNALFALSDTGKRRRPQSERVSRQGLLHAMASTAQPARTVQLATDSTPVSRPGTSFKVDRSLQQATQKYKNFLAGMDDLGEGRVDALASVEDAADLGALTGMLSSADAFASAGTMAAAKGVGVGVKRPGPKYY